MPSKKEMMIMLIIAVFIFGFILAGLGWLIEVIGRKTGIKSFRTISEHIMMLAFLLIVMSGLMTLFNFLGV
jgi:hypothetical protein